MSLICPKCGDNRVVYFQGKHKCKNCGEEFERPKPKDYAKAILIGACIVIPLALLTGLILKAWLSL